MSSSTEQSATHTSAQASTADGLAASTLSTVTAEELARRAQRGSVECFGELVDRMEGPLIGYFRRRVGPTHAEDLAQETFVRVWGSLDRFDPERSFTTWMFTIASRLAADHYRAKARDQRMLQRRANENGVAINRSPDEAQDEAGEGGIWDVAREMLNDEQFSALWLRYVMEMGISELASVLGKNKIATRVMLFRIREKLGAAVASERAEQHEAERAERAGRGGRGSEMISQLNQAVVATPGGARCSGA